MSFRYTLERYRGAQTRHTCPGCGRAGEFVRYIDTQNNAYLADNVGRCNREVNCGYHYTPKQYFAEHKISPQISTVQRQPKKVTAALPSPIPISFIPIQSFHESLTAYMQNNFVRYLHGLFGAGATGELIKRFYIGTSHYWRGATVYWQIDVKGRVRSGKIMLYDSATGRRVKEIQPNGSKLSKITWAHSVMQRQGVIQDFNLRQCLFGEHQLELQSKNILIAIVEAEKTAIIATHFLPDFVWLACGSSTNLTPDKCRSLTGRKVVLFPDLTCFEKWSDKARQLASQLDCRVSVSDLLERKASRADRAQGFDLADYLVRNGPARGAGIGG